MKKLWLSAITAACLLAGSVANAGDWHGATHYNGGHRDWDRHDYRSRDDRHGWGQANWRGAREVYYRPAPMYYRQGHYYPQPVYRDVGYRVYGNGLHGSITLGF